MTQVKVCGLMTLGDIAIVNAEHPDYAGFVLAGGRHHVSDETLQTLTASLDPQICKVAVVVEPDIRHLLRLHAQGLIDAVQLHRVSRKRTINALQQAGLMVISRVDLSAPSTVADIALLDAGDGSGQTLPWDQLPPVAQPLMLAGGLDATNVRQAIQAVAPQIVDASSRLETNGHKDAAKVKAFVEAVRQTKEEK
ncbi:phosphoribosylanthranilate isomerase [Lacticaseibacillus baoqingensis]|uniref:N-(5'-phosphoribosyl)anthranilate isomerase n=1 Tax=Lacticaseibacillus baoqingensis TaxID=2486013 RepID=A0ABW4E616_9LACO|nr:phosphoribosylanthranilate isomerase [Lacticaseibacillus baoqingensis]